MSKKLTDGPIKFVADFLEQRGKYVSWAKLLIGNLLFQIVLQALGFLTGLLIVRALTKDQYALFTIVGTMGPTINMIADMGITSGFLAIGGKIWQDDEKMGRLVMTGLYLRRRFALLSFTVLAPVLAWLLFRNHAPVGTALCLIVITLAGVSSQLSSGILNIVVQLRQQLPQIRSIGLKTTLLRLAIVAVLAAFSSLTASLAVLAGTCGAILQSFLVGRIVKPQIKWNVPKDDEYQKKILEVVRKVAPLTLYFCIQGQVSIWLISIFGSAHQVADLGALGRIVVVYSVIGSVVGMVIVPRFARIQEYHLLKTRFWQIILGYLFLVLLVAGIAALFPAPLLSILGPQYAHLGNLVWLVMLSGALGSFTGLLSGMNNTRGWIPPAIINIPLEIAVQIVLLMTMDLSHVRGVLLFSCLGTVPVALFVLGVSVHNIEKFRHQPVA